MNISEILEGVEVNPSIDEQKEVLEQLKEFKIFDLDENKRQNLINFLGKKCDVELAMEYLFYVLDTEISYPVDDEKVISLFSEPAMRKLHVLMLDSFDFGEEEDV